MAHDLFISYAAENKPVADAVCAFLEARSIRCWIAPRDILPGAHYGSSIIDAISASRIFLLVFSASANQSPQVMREVERAVAKGLPILPFRIEDVPLSPDMEYFISAPHWLDALTQPLEGHLAHLAETAQLLLSRMGAAPSDSGRSHGEPARDRTTVSPGREEVGRAGGEPAPDRATVSHRHEEGGRATAVPAGTALPGRKVLRRGTLAGLTVSVALVGLFGSWLAYSRLLSGRGATAIDRCPITLDRPGRYAVSRDLACSETGITISSGNVSLDLGGHTLRGSGTKPDSMPGIRAQAVAHVAIRNGTIIGFGGNGINLEGTTESEVAGIKAIGNIGTGIAVYGSNNRITGNSCNQTVGGNGFYCTGSSNRFLNNTASGNTRLGIWIDQPARNNTVRDNRMSGNQDLGILVVGRDNLIERNTAVDNGQNDLQDENPDPGNTWANNVFRTRNRPYIQ